ncbi:MAG: thioredoxin family protein [Myxococcales bacterium]
MRIGALMLLAAFAFAGTLVLDVGGLRSRLFAEGLEKQREIAPRLPPPSAQKPSAPITPAWYLGASGYEGAELERQSAGANMVIYFQKRACEPCREFEHEVLASPEVKSFLADVVKVRVDPDGGVGEHKLAARFGVSGVPAVAVVPHQGPPHLLPDRALSNPHLLVAFSR